MSTTTKPVFRMGTDELLATARERTDKGNLTAAAKRARKEADRRDAKRSASSAPVASSARVTDVQVDDLLAQAKRAANRLASEFAGEIAEPGDIVRTKIRIRKDLLGALDNLGPEQFLAIYTG